GSDQDEVAGDDAGEGTPVGEDGQQVAGAGAGREGDLRQPAPEPLDGVPPPHHGGSVPAPRPRGGPGCWRSQSTSAAPPVASTATLRSEEHTSELQSRENH